MVIYRDEIAGCSEKAYDSLSINDARQMLMFSSDQELSGYINEVSLLFWIVFLSIWEREVTYEV